MNNARKVCRMKKQTVRKDDGRYIIFYAFEKPLPAVHEAEQSSKQSGASDLETTPGQHATSGSDTSAGGDQHV